MEHNQRRQDRTKVNIPILEFTGSHKIYGETINLSETGLCYFTPITKQSSYNNKRIPLQTIALKSPLGGERVYIFGEIVYEIRKDDFIITGLEFRQLDKVTIASIKRILVDQRALTGSYRFINQHITTTH